MNNKSKMLIGAIFIWALLWAAPALAAETPGSGGEDQSDANAVEQIQPGQGAATLEVQADTSVYATKRRDYFWMKNEAATIAYEYRAGVTKNSGTTEALLVDCRFYLPMQMLVVEFGEDMAWDGVIQSCYVVRDQHRTYMSTIRINDTPYVRIRDFECLGYKVDYQGLDHKAMVTMIKPI